jgi:hypothetical protein
MSEPGASAPLGEARGEIACPACGFVPPQGYEWLCGPDGCGGLFDTFATHGRCPHCEAQFAWTQCPSCGRGTAHQAWYRRTG